MCFWESNILNTLRLYFDLEGRQIEDAAFIFTLFIYKFAL